jgi:hypothetical protein
MLPLIALCHYSPLSLNETGRKHNCNGVRLMAPHLPVTMLSKAGKRRRISVIVSHILEARNLRRLLERKSGSVKNLTTNRQFSNVRHPTKLGHRL